MRGLAAELGIGTMTLYGYFRTKDELINAAVGRAGEQIMIPEPGGDWRADLRALIQAIYATLRRYPVALELRSRGPLHSPGVLRTTEAGLEFLAAAGFGKEDRARAWRLLFTYAFGYAAFTPESLTSEQQRSIHAELSAFPPAQLPRVTESIPEAVAAMSGDETFDHGLDLILDGLEARSPERRI